MSEYIVGEEGPELFVPDQAGTIVPNDAPPTIRVTPQDPHKFLDFLKRLRRPKAQGAREVIAETVGDLGAHFPRVVADDVISDLAAAGLHVLAEGECVIDGVRWRRETGPFDATVWQVFRFVRVEEVQ